MRRSSTRYVLDAGSGTAILDIGWHLRILLESVLRNLDGRRIGDEDVLELARWQPRVPRIAEVPFVVGASSFRTSPECRYGRPGGDAFGGGSAWS